MSFTAPLSGDQLRRCLRIASGATLGFLLCKVMNWNYGVFFTVTPMLLLGTVPALNRQVTLQLLAAPLVSTLEVGLLGGIFGGYPLLMTPIVFGLFLYRFACMSRGNLFLFGANGVLILSIMLHFASYPGTDLNDLFLSTLMGNAFSAMVAWLLVSLFPDSEPPASPAPAPKPSHRLRHEALLGATLATLSFVVFQICDLSDSMSAQATTLMLLFPMNWNGALTYARKRALGTLLGVGVGLGMQLLLYDWSGVLLLVTPLLWLGCMVLARIHVGEGGSGIGFGALSTLGILFGQYLSPNRDLVFSALYRVSSIGVAIVVTLALCYLLHQLLNRFEATRYGTQA